MIKLTSYEFFIRFNATKHFFYMLKRFTCLSENYAKLVFINSSIFSQLCLAAASL